MTRISIDPKELILEVSESKNGQKRITIPKKCSFINDGDYVAVKKFR